MIEKKIKLETIEDVKKFVTAATEANFDADLTADRFVVDAKSILGIFSLNLANVITLHMYTEDSADAQRFLKKIQTFIID